MMNNYLKLGFAMFMALVVLPSISQAALVTPEQPVIFSFDTSASGALNLTGFTYSTNLCGNEDGNEQCLLGSGNSFDMLFGMSSAGNDIGQSTFTNPFDFSISNASTVLLPAQAIPGSLTTLYVTLAYSDDIFDVESLILSSDSGQISGQLPGVSNVPVPAAFWLFGTALIGFIGISRRTKVA